jgi:hypothetical protein
MRGFDYVATEDIKSIFSATDLTEDTEIIFHHEGHEEHEALL